MSNLDRVHLHARCAQRAYTLVGHTRVRGVRWEEAALLSWRRPALEPGRAIAPRLRRHCRRR